MPEKSPEHEAIRDALVRVTDPASGRDVVSLGWVRHVRTRSGSVEVLYQIPAERLDDALRDALTTQTQRALEPVGGVEQVHVDFTVVMARATNTLPGVRHVIAVGAGKGGVGKSTVAAMLAFGLKARGLRAGLLDADVYGPSLPKITGTETGQVQVDDQGRLHPPERDGVPVMSMGHLVPADQAVIWRGPMAQRYVKELLDRGDFGELDYLIVDLPPGTGDIPLTLAQSIPLSGAVVVCTPQDVALLDAIKALRMYERLSVDPLGIVENMSYYICPQCGHRDEIFDHGGAEQAAAELGVRFLGAIPLNAAIRVQCDAGRPAELLRIRDGHVAEAVGKVVAALIDEVETRARQRTPLPQLRITD